MNKVEFLRRYNPENKSSNSDRTLHQMLFDLESVIEHHIKEHLSKPIPPEQGRDLTKEEHEAFLIAWETINKQKNEIKIKERISKIAG